MELISRITVRCCEMGGAGDEVHKPAPVKTLAIFRVLGRSKERAMKILNAEMARGSGQVMVLSILAKKLTEDEKHICTAAMEQGIRQSTKIVFCGGDPGQIFGRLAADGNALKWFPSIPSFISTYEIDGGRQTANAAR
jgi:hypothetical protein